MEKTESISMPINFDTEKLILKQKYKIFFDELMETAFDVYSFLQLKVETKNTECLGGVLKTGEWIFIALPPAIDSNARLFIMAHEVGHLVAGHHLGEAIDTLEREMEADAFALKKFEEWGLKVTDKINDIMRMNRLRFLEDCFPQRKGAESHEGD